MKYERQSSKPEWYDSNSAKTYTKVTFGSSPFNEWYEFENRSEAIEHFADQINIDHFHWLGGEIFHIEDLFYDEVSEGFMYKKRPIPADLGEIAQSVSRF